MTGGAITGNNATNNGGGVFQYGTMTVGGTAQITGNTVGTTTNNVHLGYQSSTSKTITLGTGSRGNGVAVRDHAVPSRYIH